MNLSPRVTFFNQSQFELMKTRVFELLDQRGILHGVGAAGPTAVVDCLIWGIDALNHDDLPELSRSVNVLSQLLFQGFNLGRFGGLALDFQLRTQLLSGAELADAIAAVNSDLHQRTEASKFITLAGGVIDGAMLSSTVTVACAALWLLPTSVTVSVTGLSSQWQVWRSGSRRSWPRWGYLS